VEGVAQFLKRAELLQNQTSQEKGVRKRLNLEVKSLESELKEFRTNLYKIRSGLTIFDLQEEQRKQAEDGCVQARGRLADDRHCCSGALGEQKETVALLEEILSEARLSKKQI